MKPYDDVTGQRAKERWNEAYDLAASPNLWGDAPAPLAEAALHAFTEHGTVQVLEIPCGDGRNTIPLTAVIPHVTGVDASANALQITHRRLSVQNVRNCLLMLGDILSLPFLDEQFDGVFCCDLLGHLKEPLPAIREILRVCKEGGCLVGNVFSLGDSTRGLEMQPIGPEEYIYRDKFFFKFYDKADVEALLDNLACKILNLRLIRWEEPPHEGYREYPHEHESWVFEIQK